VYRCGRVGAAGGVDLVGIGEEPAMSPAPRTTSIAPPTLSTLSRRPPHNDAYWELLSQTRGLGREQQQARDAWLADLGSERKEEVLFELEILLKGVACFSNPRNHAGPPRRAPVVAIDFGKHLAHWTDGLARVVDLARQLLGERDRAFVFQRYLETVLPEDTARTRLIRDTMAQRTPQESLFVLRHALGQTLELARGTQRLAHVPYRLFFALGAVAQREIAQNAFFNPLSALEFRPEFDRIGSRDVLDLIETVQDENAHRLVALTFLSLFRMLRYVGLIEAMANKRGDDRHRAVGRAHLVAAVLRSDARALSGHLRRRAGPLLSESFEQSLLLTPAPKIRTRYEALVLEGRRLAAVRMALEGISARIRLEMRRTFEHDLPSPDAAITEAEARSRFRRAVIELRPALENNVLFLGKALGTGLRGEGIWGSEATKRETSERLRRDVWMFAQIVRAFGQKAEHANADDDRWSAATGFAFVKEFLAYFQALGYPLLRAADYPRLDAFTAALGALEDTDLLEPARIDRAIVEAKAFHEFLIGLFDAISKRDELAGVPFDRRQAAESLRLYLTD
jgi:hypothetical protein